MHVAPSSSGLGRRPLKAEVAGSNPVGATKNMGAILPTITFPTSLPFTFLEKFNAPTHLFNKFHVRI